MAIGFRITSVSSFMDPCPWREHQEKNRPHAHPHEGSAAEGQGRVPGRLRGSLSVPLSGEQASPFPWKHIPRRNCCAL